MGNLVLTEEKNKERLEQAKEMEIIWNTSDEMTQMYLRGCMATINALAGNRNKNS